MKRTFDITVALLFVILFWWLFVGIAIAIKIDDGGPVFYVHNRVGLYGREFKFYKFRSMRTDADKMLDSIRHLNETSGELFKIKDDPRITRVGKFLRKTSLDELPQFLLSRAISALSVRVLRFPERSRIIPIIQCSVCLSSAD